MLTERSRKENTLYHNFMYIKNIHTGNSIAYYDAILNNICEQVVIKRIGKIDVNGDDKGKNKFLYKVRDNQGQGTEKCD